MPTEQEIAAAKALLEQEGFSVRHPSGTEWKMMGAVVTCNVIANGLTEKRFVQMIESALSFVFSSRATLSKALQHDVAQMGPLHVKSYTRVKAGLRRKGEEIAE